jgi:hypothetical protein
VIPILNINHVFNILRPTVDTISNKSINLLILDLINKFIKISRIILYYESKYHNFNSRNYHFIICNN